jgi:hypothetical protein
MAWRVSLQALLLLAAVEDYSRSIIGATEKRREGSGRCGEVDMGRCVNVETAGILPQLATADPDGCYSGFSVSVR